MKYKLDKQFRLISRLHLCSAAAIVEQLLALQK